MSSVTVTGDKRYQISNDYRSKHGGYDDSGQYSDVTGIATFGSFERRDRGTIIWNRVEDKMSRYNLLVLYEFKALWLVESGHVVSDVITPPSLDPAPGLGHAPRPTGEGYKVQCLFLDVLGVRGPVLDGVKVNTEAHTGKGQGSMSIFRWPWSSRSTFGYDVAWSGAKSRTFEYGLCMAYVLANIKFDRNRGKKIS